MELGYLSPPPIYWNIWDDFTEKGGGGSGTPMVSYGNDTTALGTALTSQDVYFDGSNANAANGGNPPELYAPATWQSGSSYSHLDESYNGTDHALMTYALADGESEHSPGGIVLGILRDIGWPTPVDLRISKRVVGPDPGPNEWATFRIDVENIGGETASSVVVTDTIPAGLGSLSWNGTPGVTLAGGTYVWNLPNLDPAASAAITVVGRVDAGLPTTYTIWNKAYVGTSSYEAETGNNQSTAAIGGWRVYLPLTVRNH